MNDQNVETRIAMANNNSFAFVANGVFIRWVCLEKEQRQRKQNLCLPAQTITRPEVAIGSKKMSNNLLYSLRWVDESRSTH